MMLHFDEAKSFLNGKLWVFWLADVSCDCMEVMDQLVHVKVGHSLLDEIHISAVYAKHSRVERRRLWEAMGELSRGIHTPWMVAGDFNVVSQAEERVGGNPPNIRDMEEFHLALVQSGLSVVPFTGNSLASGSGDLGPYLAEMRRFQRRCIGYPFHRGRP